MNYGPRSGIKASSPKRIIGIALIFASCNFTSQSYNHGKLLNPGETLVSVGIGKRQYYSIKQRDSLDRGVLLQSLDTVRYHGLSLCLDYRLGVLRKLPLGKGLEIGFHLEGPSQLNPNERLRKTGIFRGVALLDFDGRFGLKDVAVGSGLYHHNIGLGWSVGAWIDNGWFAEYAAGWEYKSIIPYANFRAELLATDPSSCDSLTESYTPFKYQKRSWTTRTAAGLSVYLPHLFFLQPDVLSPEISVVYPHFSAISHYGITYHVALRWLNGM